MDGVVIITPKNTNLATLVARVRGNCHVTSAAGRYIFEHRGSRAHLGHDHRVPSEFEADEWKRIHALIPTPEFFVFEFNDPEFGLQILADIIDDPQVLVDDDYGTICSGPELLVRLRSCSSWSEYWEHVRARRRMRQEGGG